MQKLIVIASLLIFTFGSCAVAPSHEGHLRHVVLFAFKSDTTPQQIASVESAALALKDQISEILAYEWGTDVSTENRAHGFTHCVFITFADAAARDIYLPHPAHKSFIEVAMPFLEDVLVLDYIAHE